MENFEDQPCNIEDLTFDFLENDDICFQAFETNQELFRSDRGFTNLALFFSDQSPYNIQVSRFIGTDRSSCSQRTVSSGPLVRQLEEVSSLLLRDAGYEKPDYPVIAVKETLINCLCHRDYSVSGSIQVSIFDDRLEFVNLGGIISDMDLPAIYLGIAHSRNPHLATILYCMNLMDNYGTGIDKIRKAYKGQKHNPEFQTARGVFKVTLPNCNIGQEEKKKKAFFQSEQDQILAFAREQGFVTRREVEELLEAGSTKSYTILQQLADKQLLSRQGSGRNSIYVPME